MTFLTPIPAIIAACITLPILLLYYFLKLRRRAVRVSSILLWERAIKDVQVNTPFRWLRSSLLLFLHLLILLSLLLALARPAIDDPLAASRRVVILIDRSASMDALDGIDTAAADSSLAAPRVTRLAQAKLEAARTLDKLAGGGWLTRLLGSADPPVTVCVIDFAATPRIRAPFTTDLLAVREAISAVVQTDQPGNLAAALQLIAGLTAGTTDESASPEPTTLFIFSDGSFTHALSDLTMPAARVRYIQIGPTPLAPPNPDRPDPTRAQAGPPPAITDSPTMVEPSRPVANELVAPSENLGITAIRARRDAESPSTVRVFVRVQSTAPRTVRATATLSINGAQVQTRTFSVGPPDPVDPASLQPPGVLRPSDLPAPPFEAPVIFEVTQPDDATLVVSISAIDLLASDNAAALVLAAPRTPRIVVVARDAAPDELLMLALDGLSPAALTNLPPAFYEQFARGEQVIDAAGNQFASRPGDWDLIVFDRYRPEQLPLVPSMSIGASLPIPGLSVSSLAEPAASFTRFSTWRRTHPIMRSVNLDGIILAPPMSLQLPNAPSLNTVPLAWGDATDPATGSGPLIALIEPAFAATPTPTVTPPLATTSPPAPSLQSTKHLVLAFELAQSNWGIEFSFPVFIVNAVEYLASLHTGLVSRAYSTAEPIGLSIPPGQIPISMTDASVEGPIQLDAPIRRGNVTPSSAQAATSAISTASPAEIAIGTLERAGLYRITSPNTLPPSTGTLAVNLADPWESRAAVATSLDLPVASPTAEAAARADARREIWRWLVALVALLLVVEWVVFARAMRA